MMPMENECIAGGELDAWIPLKLSMAESPQQIVSQHVSGEAAPDVQAELAPEMPQKALRIGWLAGPETFGRIGRILQPLAVGLMDELVGVTVFIPERSDERELPSVPLDVIRYSRSQWPIFRNRLAAALAQELENRQIHLIHALDANIAPLARRLSLATGINYVTSCFGLHDGDTLGPQDQATALLAASEPVRRGLLERHVVPADRMELVRPGVYMVAKPTYYTDPTKSIAIVTSGRLDDYEAYEALLRTFAEIKNRNYDCTFFVIGNGKAEHRIRTLGEQLGLNSRLTFIDRQPLTQLQGILKAADIYIAPAPSETVDIASLLAMAAGDPVIAARSAVDDFFIDTTTALLFDKNDAGTLTRHLLRLLDDQQEATRLAEGALAYLRENHGAASMVTAVTRIYRGAIDQSDASSVRAG